MNTFAGIFFVSALLSNQPILIQVLFSIRICKKRDQQWSKVYSLFISKANGVRMNGIIILILFFVLVAWYVRLSTKTLVTDVWR